MSYPRNAASVPGLAQRLLILMLCGTLLGGCAAVVAGGAAVVVTDRRSTGTVIDDQTVEIKVVDRLHSDPGLDADDHIKVEVYNGIVLLVGEVQNAAKKRLATELAEAVENTERVVNELEVTERAGMGGKLDNTWLTTKVNAALVKDNPVPGFDATRIKVVSARNNVYLMGLVTREEGDAVAEVARNVSGVDRVIKVFSYMD
ncbi:MAG: BON domain-containing protein [Xanthomonadales bacterium]|nr:BON domain-containing protein [Xanthomonadales bacterium]NIN59753.1 BON domain-containing protein [Xanthomonadales bacterium]NIN75522.1 BON domain-containing protein [Xanthomonadales bacterium]NIO15211.1 BON domain-containing protein [Xanthomonadales bacterium]NIP12146.1 BON domain-containing protein [Xanthomonadales bacterium]